MSTARTISVTVERVGKPKLTWPAMRLLTISGAPRKGTWVTSTPTFALNSSAAR